jgi:hypothetical protein
MHVLEALGDFVSTCASMSEQFSKVCQGERHGRTEERERRERGESESERGEERHRERGERHMERRMSEERACRSSVWSRCLKERGRLDECLLLAFAAHTLNPHHRLYLAIYAYITYIYADDGWVSRCCRF